MNSNEGTPAGHRARDPLASEWVRVWDPVVRVAHWVLVIAFLVAYVSDDDALDMHVWAGYALGGIVLLRVFWGFVGPQYARFSNFVRAPRETVGYLGDLIRFRARRYLGHSPAGGAMIVTLLLALSATVISGLQVYAIEEGRGPLAGWSSTRPSHVPVLAAARADDERQHGRAGDERRRKRDQGEVWEELHEFFADLTMLLVVFHVGGVTLASVAHRENLVRAMVTGYKRRD